MLKCSIADGFSVLVVLLAAGARTVGFEHFGTWEKAGGRCDPGRPPHS